MCVTWYWSLDIAHNGQKIDVRRETIELAGTSSTNADGLAASISDSEPRYSFFRYSHEFEGQEQSPVVFIYTCPSQSKIKERMLYASSKSGTMAVAEGEAGLEIAKKVCRIEIMPHDCDADSHDSSRPRVLQRSVHRPFKKNSTPNKNKKQASQDPSGQANGNDLIARCMISIQNTNR